MAGAFALKTPDGGFLDGTFVIAQNGRVRFAARSNERFGDISQLMEVDAKSKHPQWHRIASSIRAFAGDRRGWADSHE